MDLTSNSTLHPVADRLLVELQDRGDLGDGQKLVVDIGRAALRAHPVGVVWRRVAGAGAAHPRGAGRQANRPGSVAGFTEIGGRTPNVRICTPEPGNLGR
jgi:hypothetical protein